MPGLCESGNVPAATNRFENAIPLARISKESTSTGYKACRGVQPKEKQIWKIYTIATVAALAALLPVSAACEQATVTPTQQTQHAAFTQISIGRRPSLSTKMQPRPAKTICRAFMPTAMLFCVTLSVMPAVLRKPTRKYETTPVQLDQHLKVY